jgi:hypothetical protein
MCQGNEPMARSVNGREPIFKTALDLGIVTALKRGRVPRDAFGAAALRTAIGPALQALRGR